MIHAVERSLELYRCGLSAVSIAASECEGDVRCTDVDLSDDFRVGACAISGPIRTFLVSTLCVRGGSMYGGPMRTCLMSAVSDCSLALGRFPLLVVSQALNER